MVRAPEIHFQFPLDNSVAVTIPCLWTPEPQVVREGLELYELKRVVDGQGRHVIKTCEATLKGNILFVL